MEFRQELITPEIAAMYLAKNLNNRRLDMFHVRKLAKDMNEGNWAMNGDTIRFNNEGELIDGQHRLNAIIYSGKSMNMVVVEGIEDPNAFKTIDTNAKLRNVGQILGLQGIKNSNLVGSIARRLIAWERTADKSEFNMDTQTFRYISTPNIIDFVAENNEEIQEMIYRLRNSLVMKRCGSGTALITALVLIRRFDSDKALEFVEILKSGYHNMEDSPVIKLRDRLLTPPERRGNKWELEMKAMVIKAFNKYIHDKPAKHIRWIRDGGTAEKFPIIGENSRF